MHDQDQEAVLDAHRRVRDALPTAASRRELDFQLTRDLLMWQAHQGHDWALHAAELVAQRAAAIRDAGDQLQEPAAGD